MTKAIGKAKAKQRSTKKQRVGKAIFQSKVAGFNPDLGRYFSIKKDEFNALKKTQFCFTNLEGLISEPPEGIEFTTAIDFFVEGNERFCVTFRFDNSSVSSSELEEIIQNDKIISLKFVDLCQQYKSRSGDIYIPILCELIRLDEEVEF